MMDSVYSRYFWDVEIIWAANICFNEHIYIFKKFSLAKQYFWRYVLQFYNTDINDPINKFNFMKSINDIVSVAESSYLQKPELEVRERNEQNVGMEGMGVMKATWKMGVGMWAIRVGM